MQKQGENPLHRQQVALEEANLVLDRMTCSAVVPEAQARSTAPATDDAAA